MGSWRLRWKCKPSYVKLGLPKAHFPGACFPVIQLDGTLTLVELCEITSNSPCPTLKSDAHMWCGIACTGLCKLSWKSSSQVEMFQSGSKVPWKLQALISPCAAIPTLRESKSKWQQLACEWLKSEERNFCRIVQGQESEGVALTLGVQWFSCTIYRYERVDHKLFWKSISSFCDELQAL